MIGYHLNRRAKVDLQMIWNYVAEKQSLEAADRVLDDIERGLLRVARNPSLGHYREEAGSELLFYLVHRYLIAYRPDTTPVEVCRIVHGARELGTMFDHE